MTDRTGLLKITHEFIYSPLAGSNFPNEIKGQVLNVVLPLRSNKFVLKKVTWKGLLDSVEGILLL